MKLKKLLKEIAFLSVRFIVLDCMAVPIVGFMQVEKYFPTTKNQIVVKEFKRDKDLEALEYLVLAHSITNQTLIRGENVCKQYAATTIENYERLIEEDGREDLAEDVRIAIGTVHNGHNPAQLHAWNEIKLAGEWEEFETTSRGTEILDNKDLKYQTKLRKLRMTPRTWSNYMSATTRQVDQEITRLNLEWFYKGQGSFIPIYYTYKEMLLK